LDNHLTNHELRLIWLVDRFRNQSNQTDSNWLDNHSTNHTPRLTWLVDRFRNRSNRSNQR
jgi:hypothetical protein